MILSPHEGILWCQWELKKGKAKVKWKDVCLPKSEGDLWIKGLREWNSALIATHIWRILSNHESLWCIPKHAFVLWLLIGEKLKTQDKLKYWEIISDGSLLCPLCNQISDSHDHLFFNCSYSNHVWSRFKQMMEFPIFSYSWREFTLLVSPFAKRNIARIVIVKLGFATSVYMLWQERNNRLFKGKKRTCDQVGDAILSTVRLKLMSMKWKKTPQTLRLKSDWKIS
ncbi:uncharacterized protein [Rutidosis leptorrhynchoides]|uniref:uncharacterized protein n=1 Tax=Rutidosis leptorrhynchoides TaxID=125765 RepID=UPI003A990CC4